MKFPNHKFLSLCMMQNAFEYLKRAGRRSAYNFTEVFRYAKVKQSWCRGRSDFDWHRSLVLALAADINATLRECWEHTFFISVKQNKTNFPVHRADYTRLSLIFQDTSDRLNRCFWQAPFKYWFSLRTGDLPPAVHGLSSREAKQSLWQ